MKEKYQPIACGFYDELVRLASRKTHCRLHLKDASGSERQLLTSIKDIYSRQKVEYLLLENGEEIRLDHILQAEPAEPK
ncbi:MAG: hypothetical protein AAF990_05465 [Bacteroidota bacterium]